MILFTMGISYEIYIRINERNDLGYLISANNVLFVSCKLDIKNIVLGEI